MLAVLKLLALGVFAAVLYGIVHDQVTARVCLEYFTVFHPPVFGNLRSPTLLAIGWGIIASWWVGLGLAIPLAVFARAGGRPKLDAADLVRPIAMMMVIVGLLALCAGIVGYVGANAGWFTLRPRLARRIPPAMHARFLADLAAHNASYGFGAIGGVVLWAWTWHRRGSMQRRGPRATTSDPA